jgi:hypothetical protein
MMETPLSIIEENGELVKIKTDAGAIVDLPRFMFPEKIQAGGKYIMVITGKNPAQPELAKAMLNELLKIDEET